MKSRLHLFLLPALITGLNIMSAGGVSAQTFTTLHTFDGNGGATPWASLIWSSNTLYGTTAGKGSLGNATVFAVHTDGTGFTNLHSFTGRSGPVSTNTDGAEPWAGLILSGNTLYGTAQQGGSSGNGTVFAVHTDGTGFTNLHSFDGYPSDSANPWAGLVLSGNTLYGTTVNGGSSGRGTVFAININGTGFTNLHRFTGEEGNPLGGLLITGKTLYGTTSGEVFAVNTDGTGFTNLHFFAAASTNASGFYTNCDGFEPHANLILSGNILYGTAFAGGSWGNGTVFAVNTNGTGFTNLHSFKAAPGPDYTNSEGAGPWAGLILSGNTLYGTALLGGSSGVGTVFAINTDGTGFATLHHFTGSWGVADGGYPYAGLVLSGNTLYGTASDEWNDFSYGTVFSLSFQPQLTITPSGPNVILSWPTSVAGFDYTGYTLQSTTNLDSRAVWSTVSPGANPFNGQNTVTNLISGPRQFYRLSQ